MATLIGQYISQSFGGVINLSTNTGIVTGSFTQLQDGFGTTLGVLLNGQGAVSASSFSGSLFGTASYAIFATNGFPYTGSAKITGSLGVTGSISVTNGVEVKAGDLDFSGGNINIYNGNVNQTAGAVTFQTTIISGSVISRVRALTISSQTASMDLSTGNLFTLTLVSGSITHINPTNLQRGQTSMLQVTQPSGGGGSVSFNTSVKFPTAFAYTASIGSSVIDTIAFVSFNGTTLNGVASYNFQ
jgi:hypothetical protein